MRRIPGNWFLRWLATQLSPLWQWFMFLCLALAYIGWRGGSPVQLDLLTIAVGLLWLVAYAFRWFVDRAGVPPFEARVIPGGMASTAVLGGEPSQANPFLQAYGVRLSFTGYSGSYWVPIYHWLLEHSRALRATCWSATRNRFAMSSVQLKRAHEAAAVLGQPPGRLVDLSYPISLRSMYHESGRGRFVMLGWYWYEVLRPGREGAPAFADLAQAQEEMVRRLGVSSGSLQESRSEFLRENPLLTYWPLAPHGESNPALLLRDDGSLAPAPACVVETESAAPSGEAGRGQSWRELLFSAQRLASGGLAPLVAGVLLLAPVTGFVPWSALTGKILTVGYAVALTYLAASEAARKLAGRKPDPGDQEGLTFAVDGTQFHVTVLATEALDRLAAWASNLSVTAVDIHSLSAVSVREMIRLVRPAAGKARLRVLSAGRDRFHFADAGPADDVADRATRVVDGRSFGRAEAHEMGFPSGLDLILFHGSDITGRERVAGIIGFRSCRLEVTEERLAMIADLLPVEPVELTELLRKEGYVLAGRIVTSGLPRLSIAFFGGPGSEYIDGAQKTFELLWNARVPEALATAAAAEDH